MKFVTAFDQIVAMIGVIIDLAVIDDHARTVAIEHRLRSVSNVNYAQTAMPEADVFIDKHTFGVRPAMMQNVSHLHEFCFFCLSA